MSATPQRQEQQKILLIPLYDLSITNHRITKKYYTPHRTARAIKMQNKRILLLHSMEKKICFGPRVYAGSNLPLIPEFSIFIASFPCYVWRCHYMLFCVSCCTMYKQAAENAQHIYNANFFFF